MPSGYTAGIKPEGLVTLRDEPGGGDRIPEEFAPAPYYMRNLEDSERRLREIEGWDRDEIIQQAATAHAVIVGDRIRWADTRRQQHEAYEAMLAKVREWVPPTPKHEDLKSFMVQQITESIKFDCAVWWDEAPEPSPAAWHEREIEARKRDVERAKKHAADEIQRASAYTAWVRALRASLVAEPAPEVAPQ